MNSLISRYFFAIFLFACLNSSVFCRFTISAEPAQKKPKTVSLVVDYADGVEKRFKEIPWRNGLTILDVMETAKRHARGIKFEQRGKASTAFIRQIDDLKNQGSRGKNWVYRVNQKLGEKSFAIYELKPKDTILWKFDTYP